MSAIGKAPAETTARQTVTPWLAVEERCLARDARPVASLFVSRWGRAVADKVPEPRRNTLGIAVGQATSQAWRDLLAAIDAKSKVVA